MEETKIQALHDSLSKLRRAEGLGRSSQYSWSAAPTKTDENGNAVREDGLPTNALYANFLPEGSYDRNSNATKKHGDGRAIKRNFDDCGSSDEDSEARRRRKAEKKERKKAEKKAAKLEAKRQAKLEEKRKIKREGTASQAESVPKVNGKSGSASAHDEKAIKTAKKTLKGQESGTMKIKELAKAVAEKIGGKHDVDSVKKLIKTSNEFEIEGKLVRFVDEKKKQKRNEKDEEDSSVISAVPSSPPPKKRRKKDKKASKQ